jgi:hypothetical protein
MSPRHRIRRVVGAAVLVSSASLAAPACLDRPLEPIEPRTTSTIHETLKQSRIDKVDILLVIDDSGSMSDKQTILSVAVPNLVDALVEPACVDKAGASIDVPAGQECPDGYTREFEAINDIHVGVINTSLGARGVDNAPPGCVTGDAELIHADPQGTEIPTFENGGFLAWQPNDETGAPGIYGDRAVLGADLEKIVQGVGQSGCGLEAQLESWYRFLVDPDPYDTIENNGKGGPNTLVGTDTALLAQRRAFLRPDSLVAIVLLSDENDCSFRDGGQGHWTAGRITSLKPRQECAADPNDPCCAPCGEKVPESCPADPTCSAPAPADNKLANVTCFDQKRRFGVDLLYPIQRYVDGLTLPQINDRHGNLVDNPLFVSDGIHRDRSRVFFTGIVGVPWQAIARNPNDLTEGLQTADELTENGTWDAILGDPDKNVSPTDPHMVESIYPRAGLPDINATSPTADPISGHEYMPRTDNGWGDLQHACNFELPTPITCGVQGCDCDPNRYQNNPLCQDAQGQYHTDTQFRAKAYPGLRQLGVLRGIGTQAIVGSICPAQISDPTRADYGYLPTIEALIARLTIELKTPCLNRSLTPDEKRQVACVIIEGTPPAEGGGCGCDYAPGRSDVLAAHQPAVEAAKSQLGAQSSVVSCFCEIDQLAGDDLTVCQEEITPEAVSSDVDGWCYIDAGTFPKTGNEELVSHCPSGQRRTLRFVGDGEPVIGSTVFISCHED